MKAEQFKQFVLNRFTPDLLSFDFESVYGAKISIYTSTGGEIFLDIENPAGSDLNKQSFIIKQD